MMEEQFKKELLQVKQLGEQIGYGNLMSMASSLWRYDLKKNNFPIVGAFVPVIKDKLDKTDLLYDGMVEKVLK